jgi:hypothetical protein
MRKSMTLSWIEQAEAARVLIDADLEQASTAAWRGAAIAAFAGWLGCLRDWLTLPQADAGAAMRLQPVRIRAARQYAISDDQNFGCHW